MTQCVIYAHLPLNVNSPAYNLLLYVNSPATKCQLNYLHPVIKCQLTCLQPAMFPSISSMYVYLYQNWLARGKIVTALSQIFLA